MFISPTAAADYNERFRDMYTFSELILNIRKVGKIDSRKMQGQSAFNTYLNFCVIAAEQKPSSGLMSKQSNSSCIMSLPEFPNPCETIKLGWSVKI